MKKTLLFILVPVIFLFAAACTKQDSEISDNEFLLCGKWRSGTLYYKYSGDHTGVTWDTGDDVTEEEGKNFSWSLTGTELKHIYITEVKAVETKAAVPKIYTVRQLTETSLVYEDDFGKVFSFVKVE